MKDKQRLRIIDKMIKCFINMRKAKKFKTYKKWRNKNYKLNVKLYILKNNDKRTKSGRETYQR